MEEDDEDKEIERINRRKMQEMMARTSRSQSTDQGAAEDKPIVLTDSTFTSEVARHELMVVDFWAPWCGPCRMVGPIVEQLAKEYAGRVVFGKLNVDENPAISNAFGVQSIPTMLVFHKGKAVDGLIGAVPKSTIENKFKPYLGDKGGTGSSASLSSQPYS